MSRLPRRLVVLLACLLSASVPGGAQAPLAPAAGPGATVSAWTPVATVRASSAEFEGKDPRAAHWSPLPVWDPGDGRWNRFYVAYRAMPTDGTRFLLNHAGEIWRAVSRTAGPQGIGGPFEDVGVIMRPGPDSVGWEGLQGTDSFFPWSVGGRWRAFYGSARTETRPIGHWLVGPAEAPSLAGPWRRVREDNPAAIATRLIENSIVTEVPGGGWLAVTGPRLDTHPRHGDKRGDLRDRFRGADAGMVTNVGRHSLSQTDW